MYVLSESEGKVSALNNLDGFLNQELPEQWIAFNQHSKGGNEHRTIRDATLRATTLRANTTPNGYGTSIRRYDEGTMPCLQREQLYRVTHQKHHLLPYANECEEYQNYIVFCIPLASTISIVNPSSLGPNPRHPHP